MKILVTGGAGFIASHVVDAYVAAGHDVTVLDNFSTGRRENLNPRATVVEADIRTADFDAIFKDTRFDVVNHHAAQIDVRRSVSEPVFDAGVNVVGTLNLLEYCVRSKVKRVIFASTGGAIYGEIPRGAAREDREVLPLSPYAIAKYSVENYLCFYQEIHKLNYLVLRYGNVYGPRQDPHGEAGVVAIFFGLLRDRKQPLIFGSGKAIRDYVFVGDVARANLLALKSHHTGIINIGTSIGTSVNQLYQEIARFFSNAPMAVHQPARPGELARSILAYGKAKKVLKWAPRVSLHDGLGAVHHALFQQR